MTGQGPQDQLDAAPAPPAAGVRLAWEELPARRRDAVEAWLGSPVVAAVAQQSGFSPGVAARLRTADGRRVFVKAAGPEPNPVTPAMHRRESAILRALPPEAPVPRLLWSCDEGEQGWVVLAMEDVDGRHPALPWRMDELERVMEALVGLAAALTPSPLSSRVVGTAAEQFTERLCGWQRLLQERPDGLDAWSARHLDALAGLEAQAPVAVTGDTLLHFDIRADNLLLTPQHVWFVDWPLACVGAAWVDPVFFAPSVTMQGGPPPDALLQLHPACRAADPQAITAAIAAVAGFFTHRALQPPPPGIPTVRAFQAAQGVIARRWLAERTGWS
jgi:aminoglycoside phosphotransferase (APT) family kinase protein